MNGDCFTVGGRAVAVLNCRPLATSARLELAVLLRSGFPASPEPKHLEPVLLKTWHFPTNVDGARDVPRLRHPHVLFVHARKHPSRFSTLGGRAVAVLNCRPLATSARLELAVLLRSGFPASPEPKHLEPVLLKTWHFPTRMLRITSHARP